MAHLEGAAFVGNGHIYGREVLKNIEVEGCSNHPFVLRLQLVHAVEQQLDCAVHGSSVHLGGVVCVDQPLYHVAGDIVWLSEILGVPSQEVLHPVMPPK